MRCLLLSLVICIKFDVFAQDRPLQTLDVASSALNSALVKRDSNVLRKLLFDGAKYSLLDGFVQSKEQVIMDLYNGTLTYRDIDRPMDYTGFQGDTAYNWSKDFRIDVLHDGKRIALEMNILDLWIWKGERWQLLSRQREKNKN